LIRLNPKIELFTALITPFNTKFEINNEIIKDLIKFQIQSNIDGIVVCGTTGEFPSLTVPEIVQVIEIANNSKKNIKLIAGIGRNSIKETLYLANQVSEKVDAFLISPPSFFKPLTLNGLYTYYSRILSSIETPIIIYNIPKYTGIEITDDLINKLLKFQNFLGIKDSSGNIQNTINWISKYSELKIFNGSDALIFDAVKNGVSGSISAISNIFPIKIKTIIDEIQKNNLENAKKIQDEIFNIRSVIKSFPTIAALKSLLNWREITLLKSRVRPPLIDLTNEEDLELYNKINRWFHG